MPKTIGDPCHELFYRKVQAMRQAQKDYFAAQRNPGPLGQHKINAILDHSKQLEREVDQLIEQHNSPDLFSEQA